MKSRTILFCLLLHFCCNLKSQTKITGVVTDSLNNPVTTASVYLSKTTFGTFTDSKGAYSLAIPQDGVYELIISSVGYKTFSQLINADGRKQTINVTLKVKLIQLKEVTVSAKDKNRLKNYTQFARLFLGETSNSRYCRIMNSEDMHLHYNTVDKTLTGFSLKPLRIENRALGYSILYDLLDFKYNLETGILRFSGNYYFQPLKSTSRVTKKYALNRLSAYYGSKLHFLRALYSDSLFNESFKIYARFDFDSLKNKLALQNPLLVKDLRFSYDKGIQNFYDKKPVWIYYKDEHPELSVSILGFQSQEYISSMLFSDTITLFPNGYYFNPYSITWEGKMANERVADLLPYDFLPHGEEKDKPYNDILLSPVEKYLLSLQSSESSDQVFVHLDRNKYRPDDTIFFQAYIRDRITGSFESGSVSMYALLFNDKQVMVDSARFKIDNSTSSGWMTIPLTAGPGKYHFAAFTSMMQNYDPSDAFQLDLSVSGKGNFPGIDDKGISKINNQPVDSLEEENRLFELRFLPEGGTLVSGLEQRIGFNATNFKGESVYIEGLLKTGARKVLDTIKSGLYGPGLFVCKPEPGMYIEITRGAGKEKIWPLPDPIGKGFCLSVKEIDNRSFSVEIQSDHYDGEKVTVSGAMNMTQIISKEVILDKKQRIVVETDQLPSGVAQITLFNAEMRPVAERLIYVNADKHLKFYIIPGSEVYSPGQESQLTISVTDGQGNPAEGAFSISVIDSISGYDPEIFTPGIEYSFNYHPYFLINLPPKVILNGFENLTAEDRDLLLMVYGWCKYNWDFTQEEKQEKELINFDLLKIKVLDESKRHLTNRKLDLVSLEGPSIMHLLLNKNGEITLPLDSLPEMTRSVSMMPDTKNKRRVTGAMLSIPYNEQYFKSSKLFIQQPIVLKDEYSIPPVDYKFSPGDSAIEIPEVIIKGHQGIKKIFQNIYEERYQYADVKSADQKLLQNSLFLETTLRTLTNPYLITKDNIILRQGTSMFGGAVGALIVLDGMPLYFNGWQIAKSIPVNEIASLTVIMGNQGRTFYGLAASGGVIFINTMFHNPSQNNLRTDWKSQNKNSNMLLPINLYRSNIEFYSPTKIDLDNDPVFQSRPTIFWKSEVYFNGQEPVKLKYTNSKRTGPVSITVNGVSVNNLAGTGRGSYRVEK